VEGVATRQIRPHLPAKYAPLQTASGHGLQSVYLAEVPETMAQLLAELIGEEYHQVVSAHQSQVLDEGNDDLGDREERAIAESKDIGETERLQLTKARRGQGLFKSNVRLNEYACRVTGTADVAHLRASHIKPWKVSSNSEKLDGCNGLLLSPHIDHLFDRGYISFGDDGQLLVSAQLNDAVLSTWQISMPRNVGVFNDRQCTYLQYHRQHVLKV
jgi:putative restriction endonuclease